MLGIFAGGFGIDGPAYLALLWVAFAAYLAMAIVAPALGRRALWGLIGGAVGLFALAPPLLSLDVFSYVGYGAIQAEGLNPYEVGPQALAGNEAADRVRDFADAPSVYGPLFTLVSWPLAAIGASFAVWALKALAAASVLAIAALCARFAAARGLDPSRAVALFALNPIVLVHGVGGAHNDTLMALGMLAAMWLALSARPGGAGVALAAAAAVKAAAGAVAPFVLLQSLRDGGARRFLVAGAGVALALGLAALAIWGTAATEALDVLGGSQDRISRWSAPATASRITGLDLDLVRGVAIAGFVVLTAWWLVRVARGGDAVRGAAWTLMGALLATAYMTPWYIVWALPLVVVARDRALLGFALAFTAFQLPNSLPL